MCLSYTWISKKKKEKKRKFVFIASGCESVKARGLVFREDIIFQMEPEFKFKEGISNIQDAFSFLRKSVAVSRFCKF